MKVGDTYEGYEILHNALSAPDYRFEARRGEARIIGSSLLALKDNIDDWLARVAMAEGWESATDRPAQLRAYLGSEAEVLTSGDRSIDELADRLERHLAMTLHCHRITDDMHFTPPSGITPCCRKDMVGDGERQISLDAWVKAPNITGCPFCHRSWCD